MVEISSKHDFKDNGDIRSPEQINLDFSPDINFHKANKKETSPKRVDPITERAKHHLERAKKAEESRVRRINTIGKNLFIT